MSVATVRIASVEQWCKYQLEYQDLTRAHLVVGLPVQIETSQVLPGLFCDGREWRLTDESRERIQRAAGANHNHPGLLICEHMLEMD